MAVGRLVADRVVDEGPASDVRSCLTNCADFERWGVAGDGHGSKLATPMSSTPRTIASLIADQPVEQRAEWAAALEAERAAVTKSLGEEHGRALGKSHADLASERREKAKLLERLGREEDAHRRTEQRARGLDAKNADLERELTALRQDNDAKARALFNNEQALHAMQTAHAIELADVTKKLADAEFGNKLLLLGAATATGIAIANKTRPRS
jgi:adenine-specific DNA methylase